MRAVAIRSALFEIAIRSTLFEIAIRSTLFEIAIRSTLFEIAVEMNRMRLTGSTGVTFFVSSSTSLSALPEI